MITGSDVFPDPCPGTYKYLEVQYECVPYSKYDPSVIKWKLSFLHSPMTSPTTFPIYSVPFLSVIFSRVASYPVPFRPCPDSLLASCETSSSTLLSPLGFFFHPCHAMNFSWKMTSKSFWPLFCTPFIINVLVVFPKNQRAGLWDSRTRKWSHADPPQWQACAFITQRHVQSSLSTAKSQCMVMA